MPLETLNKYTKTRYSLYVRGIFGRNRSVKFESFDLGDFDGEIPWAEQEKLRNAKLAEIRLRKPAQIAVKSFPVEFETVMSDGGKPVTFESIKISFLAGTEWESYT